MQKAQGPGVCKLPKPPASRALCQAKRAPRAAFPSRSGPGAAALSLAAFRPRSPVFTGRETGFPLLCRGQHESRADWAAGRGRALCPGGHTREALTVPCPGPAGRSVVQTLLPASPGHVVLRLFPGECNEIKASRRSQHWSLSGIIHWLQRYHVGFMPLCVSCLDHKSTSLQYGSRRELYPSFLHLSQFSRV